MGNEANVSRWLSIFAVGGSSVCTLDSAASTQLQRLEHVHLPVEEQIDFRRAAAGDGTHVFQALARC